MTTITTQATTPLLVGGRRVSGPEGVVVRSFEDDPRVARFDGPMRRPEDVDEVVVHETVSRSGAATARILRQRGLGVQLVVDEAGVLVQHGDLLARLSHAGRVHNARGVGIEVVNPYYPRLLRPRDPWTRVLEDAPWAHEKRYVLPLPAQAETLMRTVAWLASDAPGLSIPRRWPGHLDDGFALGRVAACARPQPGVLAHTYFGHADGSWLVLYAWLRLEAGLTPEAAYAEAVSKATGRRIADVSSIARVA